MVLPTARRWESLADRVTAAPSSRGAWRCRLPRVSTLILRRGWRRLDTRSDDAWTTVVHVLGSHEHPCRGLAAGGTARRGLIAAERDGHAAPAIALRSVLRRGDEAVAGLSHEARINVRPGERKGVGAAVRAGGRSAGAAAHEARAPKIRLTPRDIRPLRIGMPPRPIPFARRPTELRRCDRDAC